MSGTMDENGLRAELPWLVNGSLDAMQRERVLEAVGAAPDLQAEQRFLERLRSALREEVQVAGPGELGWRRLRRQIEGESQTRLQQHQRRRWQGLAIAASVLMAAQLAWLWDGASRDGVYEPMSAPSTAVDGVAFQLRFRPDATLAQIEAVLQRLGLRVIDGPGAAGVWRVQLRDGDAQQVLQALQAERGLIETAALD